MLEGSKRLRFLPDEVDILRRHTGDVHPLEHVLAFVLCISDEVCRAEIALADLFQNVVAASSAFGRRATVTAPRR